MDARIVATQTQVGILGEVTQVPPAPGASREATACIVPAMDASYRHLTHSPLSHRMQPNMNPVHFTMTMTTTTSRFFREEFVPGMK